MTVTLLILAFVLGVTVGAVLTVRNAHRFVARLPAPERAAFARKVTAAVRHR